MEESISLLEKLRSKAASLLIKIILVSSVLALFVFCLFASKGIVQAGIYISIALGVGLGFLMGYVTGYFRLFKEYKARFKLTFVEIPLRNIFTQVIYDGEKGIDQEVIKKTGIMCMGNRYNSNDYVQGYYKDVKFERADVKIQQHYNNGKSSYTVTYLHGRWLIFEFNKNFRFDLQIIGNSFSSSQKKSSIFTDTDQRRHRIELEDIEFNEMYDVFCQDGHEAYYILTPQFMSVLKDLHKSMDGSVMFGFVDNQLHVAINNNQDAMEPKLFDNIDLGSIKEDVQKEIDIIINIIESLGLDRNIYKN